VLGSGDVDGAMSNYYALEITGSEFFIVEYAYRECQNGDADDVMFIYSSLEITGSKSCIVEFEFVREC
jgi:hypothetical protein